MIGGNTTLSARGLAERLCRLRHFMSGTPPSSRRRPVVKWRQAKMVLLAEDQVTEYRPFGSMPPQSLFRVKAGVPPWVQLNLPMRHRWTRINFVFKFFGKSTVIGSTCGGAPPANQTTHHPCNLWTLTAIANLESNDAWWRPLWPFHGPNLGAKREMGGGSKIGGCKCVCWTKRDFRI